jgi:hypothetical protein
MPEKPSHALTSEQWEAQDYRQAARELDRWAEQRTEQKTEQDSTEYVAKLGLDESGSVIVMNRAHDRTLVPPPARAALAAFALVDQPFGFKAADLDLLERAAADTGDKAMAAELRDLQARLQALLPPPSGK